MLFPPKGRGVWTGEIRRFSSWCKRQLSRSTRSSLLGISELPKWLISRVLWKVSPIRRIIPRLADS